ncbi:MAG: hypothetical protein IPQ07_03365 [Myxococcales bacterium]|nr:hypothetical protein [Myxococcales bacterium]
MGLLLVGVARTASAGEDPAVAPAAPTTLDDVPWEGGEPAEFETWRSGLSPGDRREVTRRCTAAATEPLDVCHGIGPLGVPRPPEPPDPPTADPAAWDTARASWLAALDPPQRAYVAKQCQRARNAYTTLCGGTPPSAPTTEDAPAYQRWYRALSMRDRAWVDRQCRAHPADPDPACLGIGPLHLPTPPSLVRANSRAKWEAWYASLTPAQRRYHERLCGMKPRTHPDEPSAAELEYAYTTLCGATPLVAVFDSNDVHYQRGGEFAFTPGAPMPTDWPTAATPWLARDLDGDGAITSGAELFGSSTALPDGRIAREGFSALAGLDANHDGRIDAADPSYATLLLWSDRNGDRRSSADELEALAHRIVAIELSSRPSTRCDDRHNCEGARAQMQIRSGDGTVRDGAIVDVYLPFQLP